MKPAIVVENISKKYLLGQRVIGDYVDLRDVITDVAAAPWRQLKKALGKSNGEDESIRKRREEFWAVRNVSFEVHHGDIVGIIGRNGAGKSTLLKILSRIVHPTEGRVTIRGRVGSLLEVGTGFHPDLTGRENVYLNGSLLGMRKREIERKFDEIVAFSEIERFLDTPVKRYSSGMYVRLAFAVAAHLDPEIMIVDEVLAVGDASFQRKCLGKMQEMSGAGRTVLFVSHNLPSVQRLTRKCVWLEGGAIKKIGPSDEIVTEYLTSFSNAIAVAELEADESKPMRLRRVSVGTAESPESGLVEYSQPVHITIEYDVNRVVNNCHVAWFLTTTDGVQVVGSGDADLVHERLGTRQPGRYKAISEVPARLLNEGDYFLTVTMGIPYQIVYDRHESIVRFSVNDATSARREVQHRRRPGILGLELPWQTERLAGS